MSDGSERQFAAVDAAWEAVERNDRARLNALADEFVHPEYEDRRFEEVAQNVVLASCRLRIEGRESQVGIDREIALVAVFHNDGLLRRGRAYDSRAAALEGARELLNA